MKKQPGNSYDVTIIGAGIVGICCALSIAEKGISVRLIDRDEPGQGTSYGNAGIVSPWSIVPQAVPGLWKQIPSMLLKSDGPLSIKASYLPKLIPWGLKLLLNSNEVKVRKSSDTMDLLNHSNIELYRKHLEGTSGEYLLKDSYYVHAFRKPVKADLESLGYLIRSEKGGDLEKIGEQELRALEPALSPEFKAAILIKGQARALAPGKIGEVLAKKAKNASVEILTANVKALEMNPNDGWRIKTDKGDFTTPKIVMCAGAWSMRLLEPLGIKLPLQAERGYHLEYEEPGVTLNNSVMDVDKMLVASSMEGGLRVAGTAEFAGLEDPPNEKRIDSLRKLAKNMLPDLNTENVKTWMGIRPSMPDSLPVIDEFKHHKGLFAAFGHSHYGLMMAPKTGQIISDLVTGTPINFDLKALSSERF